MNLDPNYLQAIRSCCQDEASYHRLLTLLRAQESPSLDAANASEVRYQAILNTIPERMFRLNHQGENEQVQAELQVQNLNAALERQVEERTAQLEKNMEDLQALSQRQDDFLHAISHDLKTPVMGMQLVLKNLQKKSEDPIPLFRSVLDRMVESCDRQIQLINSLLEAHASDVKGMMLNCTANNLGELVQTIVQDLTPLLTEYQATLSNQVSHTLPLIRMDGVQIRRVYENLLTNALKHNPPGLHITLDAQIKGPEIRCTVTDNGVGLTPEECETLFERYAQGSNARLSAGLGLGLYICRQIITAHGGQIGAISRPHQGATFWFTLPLTQMQADTQSAKTGN